MKIQKSGHAVNYRDTFSEYNNYRYPKSKLNNFDYGSDSVEISEEATLRLQKDNITQLERARLKKDALKYLSEIREFINFNDADQSKIYRLNRIRDVKNSIQNGNYDFESDEVLVKTAKNISKRYPL